MSPGIRIAAVSAGIVMYPFISAALVRYGWSRLILLLFAALAIRRTLLARSSPLRLAYGLPAALLAAGAWFAEDLAARLIPAFVHLSLAGLFGYTLAHPPSLIERMVRLQYPDFRPGISEYLRQLTWMWTGLFALNVAVCAALAAFAEETVWMAYTGVGVYLPMIVLAVGETLYRPRRFPDLEMPGPLETVRAMMRHGHRVFRELRG